MREIIKDAHEHMDDGYGRAQAHTRKEMRKRFYKRASAEDVEGGFAIHLDGRPTKTPGRVLVVVPSKPLADLLVEEWERQDTHIETATMPIMRLINSAIEGGTGTLEAVLAEILSFVGNDLLLFRADSPQQLVAVQEQHWDAVLTEVSQHFSVKFRPVVGIIHQDQPEATLVRLKENLKETNHFAATALMSITGLTGSGLLAIALRQGLIEGGAAWDAAHVDEDYNAKLWGADGEAIARRDKRKTEYDAALQVLALVDFPAKK